MAILSKYITFSRCKKGDFIFAEGNPVHGIFIIKSGKVKIFNTGYREKKQVVRLASEGHILGHRALGDKYYSVSAVAIEESVLCFIQSDIFVQILKKETSLLYELMLFYADELRNSESRLKNIGQMTVREKVAEALLIIKKKFGKETKKGIYLDITLSRNDLAEISGIRTDQLIRTVAEFKSEKIISFQKKKITIHMVDQLYKLIAPFYPNEPFLQNRLYF